MTDRDIMLQAEDKVKELMATFSQTTSEIDKEVIYQKLSDIRTDIHRVASGPVDYQLVVDNLDDNILIADADEVILYVNPAYEMHSGLSRNELIGYKVSDLMNSKRYFTATTVPDVIKNKERVMKLSNVPSGSKPAIVVGVPVFSANNELQYVVASNRGLSTYTELRENFHEFYKMINKMQQNSNAVHVYKSSDKLKSGSSMIGQSRAMKNIFNFIQNVSGLDTTVLITGESGCGKELVADSIYQNSARKDKPFIKINCSSIPAQLLESELFGYEKGAFSGASSQGKKGLFEAANHGTLLLDEIGDMPLELQAKLLRVIQSSEITRVGGTKPIKLDIRLIAATNCNLKEKIANGTFRSDLYYRLHVVPIKVPPLRERKEDIPLLCDYYLNYFSELHHRSVTLSPENYMLLSNYSWPGNIRELRNIMEYLVVCCSDMDIIDSSVLHSIFDVDPDNVHIELPSNLSLNEAVAEYEKQFLKSTIKDVKNLKEASQILDVDISTISRKLKRYGLSIKD